MPGDLPVGEPAPCDGALPVGHQPGKRSFALYIHIPFCSRRCGYCDFNTYTLAELGEDQALEVRYVDALIKEIELAAEISGSQRVETIFFGGGTPTLLPASELVRILAAIRRHFPISPKVEITTEANPDSVDNEKLGILYEAGFTRISFGVQSSVPHVLGTLDRTHNPLQVEVAVNAARMAGFRHTSVDLIYGTPGESLEDWRFSIASALALPIDHISAYSLIVEEGTKFAADVRRGKLPMPDEDFNADKYILADELLSSAGFEWYEVSNWAKPGGQCRHNEMYWQNNDWWGLGAGAHSHIDGVRWWNRKLPAQYIQAIAQRPSPAIAREILTPGERAFEEMMLSIRVRTGMPLNRVNGTVAQQALEDGFLDVSAYAKGRIELTRSGRLMADALLRVFVVDE